MLHELDISARETLEISKDVLKNASKKDIQEIIDDLKGARGLLDSRHYTNEIINIASVKLLLEIDDALGENDERRIVLLMCCLKEAATLCDEQEIYVPKIWLALYLMTSRDWGNSIKTYLGEVYTSVLFEKYVKYKVAEKEVRIEMKLEEKRKRNK